VVSLRVGAAGTGGAATSEPGGRDGGSSAGKGSRGPCQPLAAENRRCGSCAFPAIPKPHLGALLPGPPSCTRSPILLRGVRSWEQAGLEGWGADRKAQLLQKTIFF